MTQTPETTTVQPTTDLEPDFWAMVALMAAVEQAEVRDLPVDGLVTPFPSPFVD